MVARDITQKDFASKMGIRPNVLSEIITGKRNITPALAIKLEAALDFDIKAEQWMRLQVGCEIDKIRIKHRNALSRAKISPKRKKVKQTVVPSLVFLKVFIDIVFKISNHIPIFHY